jgi:hypothetical protein
MFGGTYWLCCLVWGGLASDRARGLVREQPMERYLRGQEQGVVYY